MPEVGIPKDPNPPLSSSGPLQYSPRLGLIALLSYLAQPMHSHWSDSSTTPQTTPRDLPLKDLRQHGASGYREPTPPFPPTARADPPPASGPTGPPRGCMAPAW